MDRGAAGARAPRPRAPAGAVHPAAAAPHAVPADDQTSWTALIDCTLPDPQRACVFCGAASFANRRSLFLNDVIAIVEQQRAQTPEPVNTCMANVLLSAFLRFETTDCDTHADTHADLDEPVVVTCMCCYHWVSRRQYSEFVRMPLQNLFWYVKSLDFRKRRNYDARIMHRMARAVCAPGPPANYYATLFSPAELAVLREAAAGPVTEFHNVLARHYYAANGEPLFLPNADVTDAVRSAV